MRHDIWCAPTGIGHVAQFHCSDRENLNIMNTNVHHIYEHLNESSLIFSLLAEKSGDPALRKMYEALGAGRRSLIAELTHEAAIAGEQLTHAVGAGSAVNRMWLRVRDAIGHLEDGRMLADCERTENNIRDLYADAIKSDPPPDLLRVLEKQQAAVKENIATLNSALKAGCAKKPNIFNR